jgi:hypothetical protein
MTAKKRARTNKDPYATIRQLANATHVEVQHFLPYVKAWQANPDDPLLVDMNSVTVALLLYALNGQLFVAGDKTYTH